MQERGHIMVANNYRDVPVTQRHFDDLEAFPEAMY
jgi:hypothetical protein